MAERPTRPAFETEPPEGQVAVGRAVGAWGLRGHLKVEPMTDFAERFSPGNQLILQGQARRILDVKERKRQILVQLEGISTPEQAAQFHGSLLTVPEGELAPLGDDEYYRYQLLGLRVQDPEGTVVGSVHDILDTGETQVLVVKDGEGELLIPLVDDFVSRIDLSARVITADVEPLWSAS